MAYEPKPGSFSLFKNDRKEKDTHPDYKGDGLDLDGNAVWVSAWLKKGAKGTFLSCSIQPKQERIAKSGLRQEPPKDARDDDFKDSIPF